MKVDLTKSSILVCGGAGFIGSTFAKLVKQKYPEASIVVYDALTYAGNPHNLPPNIPLVKGLIQDRILLSSWFEKEVPDYIVNFAAETHNDRSLTNPTSFIETNVEGVGVLCDLANKFSVKKLVHVSTDESYGSIKNGSFKETDPIHPNTPYSAAKAGGELIALAHHNTFGTPVCITRGGNTYGPNQYPEKLIPFFLTRLLENKKIPVYGNGSAVREWIHAEDHAEGVLSVLERGKIGEIYNIGDVNERNNMEIVQILLAETEKGEDLIKYIEDPRKNAHDMRYSLCTDKIETELGWKAKKNFDDGLKETINWYKENENWWKEIQETDDYRNFVTQFYSKSLGEDL